MESDRKGSAAGSGGSRAAKRRRKEKSRQECVPPAPLSPDLARATSSPTIESLPSTWDEATGSGMDEKRASLKELLKATDTSYDLLAKKVFQTLLLPTRYEVFYKICWKKTPFVFLRGNSDHLKALPRKNSIERCLEEHVIVLNKDISVRKGIETYGERAEEVVSSKKLWGLFDSGYLLELHHPQKYFDQFWQFISLLEIEFGASVVPSIIIAPSGSQCFDNDLLADHADVFILQLKGSVSWVAASPLTVSGDMNQANGKSEDGDKRIYSERIFCGDTMYVPPEWRISGKVDVGEEAIICALRVNHNRTALHLSEMVATQSVARMMVEKRMKNQPLPSDFFSFMGVAHSENFEDPRREALTIAVKGIMSSLVSDAIEMLDAASDQISKDFISSRAPIALTPEEEHLSFYGGGRDVKLFSYSKIRMIRPGIAIAIVENGNVVVYHCMENSRYACIYIPCCYF